MRTSSSEKAKAAAADRSDALTREQLEQAITASGLTSTATTARRSWMPSTGSARAARLGVMIGAAGAGKSTLMQPLVSAWQDEGRDVHGIALAWRQADDWIDAGIEPDNAKAVKRVLRGGRRRARSR